MPQPKNIFIICGEASGELNAVNLIRAIQKINPQIKFAGLGSDLMRSTGTEVFYDIKDLSVFGLFDVFRKLPKFLGLKRIILDKIIKNKPDAVILVDFSGFNLRLAKAINKRIPVIYYISPQVWASRQGRIKTIREYISKMVVIFKFEEEFYRKNGIEVEFVGHPLLDIVKPTVEKREFLDKFNLSDSKATIALLPGSRNAEINNIFPVMLESARIISEKIKDAQFIVAKSPSVDMGVYQKYINASKINPVFIEGQTYNCLNAADYCLVASGTATLETAIMQKPFAVIYKMSLLNYLLYRPQVKVPFIGMVNIVVGKRIIPEFIQFNARPKEIAEEAVKTLANPSEISRIKNDLAQVRVLLGDSGASTRAAQSMLNFL